MLGGWAISPGFHKHGVSPPSLLRTLGVRGQAWPLSSAPASGWCRPEGASCAAWEGLIQQSVEAPSSAFPAQGSAAGPRPYFEKQFTRRLSSVTLSKEN